LRIFFSGVAGSGVSAIAGFMADRGNAVAGSDRLFDRQPGHPLKNILVRKGVLVVPQDGSGLDASVDLAVFSTAVEKDNPDLAAAERFKIPVKTRPEYLAEIVSGFQTVAVAGTSGKSTTSGMLAFVMQRLGMAPNFIGGGRVKQFRAPDNQGNYLVGNSGLLVIEACESDGSIVNYRPAFSIIANLALDHHSVDETSLLFEALAGHTSQVVISGADDENLARCSLGDVVGFSIDRKSDYQATDVLYGSFSTTFGVRGQRYELTMPGRHNLYNALACIALLSEMGAGPADIAAALPAFTGIERRFDIHLNDGRHLVLDDYAHNPHKLESLMRTMQGISRSVCYIFQPHGFGPARMMKEGYIDVFSENLRTGDRLVVLPIYYAGGTAAQDISSEDITGPVRACGRTAEVLDRGAVIDTLGAYEAYVVLGARDDSLSDFAGKIATALK
jgi:UDP-N-acetylmuramate--alanine ligase